MHVRNILLALAAVAVIAVALVHSAPIANAGGPCASTASQDGQEQAFLNLINEYRDQHDLGPLVLSSSLTRAAAWKSAHMANNNYFSHDDQGLNRDFVGRLRDCGYTANTWMAENIAAGNSSAASTFEQWRTSAGHNANMLDEHMVAIGIARAYNDDSTYGWYWTTEFGGVDDGSPPTPTPTRTPVPPPASLVKSGDVNCVDGTTSVDAALVLQLAASLVSRLPCDGEADVDGDGRTGAVDAAIILQIAAGLVG
jgi:uncharacterized protein YkwD